MIFNKENILLVLKKAYPKSLLEGGTHEKWAEKDFENYSNWIEYFQAFESTQKAYKEVL